MRMERFEYDPDAYEHKQDPGIIQNKLKGAIHLETYTSEIRWSGGERLLIIYAFFPDEDKQQRLKQQTIKYRELLTEQIKKEWNESMYIPIIYPPKQRIHFFEGIKWRTLNIDFNCACFPNSPCKAHA